MDRRLRGGLLGALGLAGLAGAMIPLRPHLAISTSALVLVVPVVLAAAAGGFAAGLGIAALGFLAFDLLFIPPYGTLSVGAGQNWVALAVYLAVTALVARVVSHLDSSRAEVERGDVAARRLVELSEILVGDRPVDELLRGIAQAAHGALGIPGVALLVLEGDRLRVAAMAGDPLAPEALADLADGAGHPVAVGAVGPSGEPRSIALVASGRPVGVLVLSELPERPAERDLLTTFANDAALALERARLREQAVRTQLLEEVDRFRQGLLGAVSHDLRTPLATIKVASSALASEGDALAPAGRAELYRLIEMEADRLGRLVANLLDLARVEAGVLTVQRSPVPVTELVEEARAALGPALSDHQVLVEIEPGLPEVLADPALVNSVLVNLLDNAQRHSPPDAPITVSARCRGAEVEVAVCDEGPGVPAPLRDAIFHRFTRLDTAGRSGLGLALARTFVEAHGGRIGVEEAPGGGARFVFTLEPASFAVEEP